MAKAIGKISTNNLIGYGFFPLGSKTAAWI
jgi:hypothetical protein